VIAAQHQVDGEIAERHRDDGIERIGIAAAHGIAKVHADHVDLAPVVVGRGALLDERAHLIPDAAQLGMTVLVFLGALEQHLPALHHGALADEADAELVGVLVTVLDEDLAEPVDVELPLRDHTAMGGAGDRRQQGGEPRVAAEHLDDHDALV